jgi:transposase
MTLRLMAQLDRKTLRKYTAPAVAAGIVPGGPAMGEADWRRLATQWFPQLVDHRLRQVSWPVIDPHRDWIAGQLRAGVTVATIHQRLRDEQGLDASVASVRRWVRANLPADARRGQVTVLRECRPPGAEAQIDYGRLGMWLDPASGRRRTVWAFVMVLACSRLLFLRPTLVMDQAEWTAAHVEAFAFFGGVPARLVPDNLKTGVDRPDLYDPKINRSYAELAAHYATLVDPARAAKPKDKAQVERPMPYVRDSFWRGREFTSLQAMREAAVRWSSEVAGQRACRPLDGAAPAAVFAAVEQQALRPLPVAPFVLATWSAARVGPDIHLLTELTAGFGHVSGVAGLRRPTVRGRVRGVRVNPGPGRLTGAGGRVGGGDRVEVGAVSAPGSGRCPGRVGGGVLR